MWLKEIYQAFSVYVVFARFPVTSSHFSNSLPSWGACSLSKKLCSFNLYDPLLFLFILVELNKTCPFLPSRKLLPGFEMETKHVLEVWWPLNWWEISSFIPLRCMGAYLLIGFKNSFDEFNLQSTEFLLNLQLIKAKQILTGNNHLLGWLFNYLKKSQKWSSTR